MSGRPVCAVLDDYQNVALAMADWAPVQEHYQLRVLRGFAEGGTDVDEIVEAIGDCEVVVAMRERTPFPSALIRRLPKLRLLVTTGMANSAIDLDAARAGNVLVCGTASSPAPPAELTWALLLAIARHLNVESASVGSGGPWQQTVGSDLEGATLGILGLGRIGSRVAHVAQAFGMDVIAWSANLDRPRARTLGVEGTDSLSSLVSACDFLSVHLRLSTRTRGLLSAEHLRDMKPTAHLVNTARAEIIDEAALILALKEGWIAGAALDVFYEEPLAKDSVFRTLPNVLCTPHIGYVSRANYTRYFTEAIEDILAFVGGAPVRVL